MDQLKASLLASLLVGAGLAHAGPGDLGTGGDGTFELLHAMKTGRACLVRGAVCLSAGGSGTVVAQSPPIAATAGDGKKAPVLALPAFARAATVAASSGGASPAGAWTLELDANLARAALAGNALFLFYDLEDPNSVGNHEVTAMHQAKVEAGRVVAARARLAPEDGFIAGHTYRLQVVQLIGGQELVLAQGDFALR